MSRIYFNDADRLRAQLEVLEEVAETYRHRTIENIIENIKACLAEMKGVKSPSKKAKKEKPYQPIR